LENRAVLKYLRVAPRKVRVVADQVRGKTVAEALSILRFLAKRGAPHVAKVLNSAVANAKQGKDIDVDALVVKTIVVDEGPTMKRFMPRAMGRATKILKRTCHVTVVVAEQ
jgi:large subunit ribosomal protein L22